MKRSNPIIPEGINSQPDAGGEGTEFLKLAAALTVIIALAGFLIFNAGRLLGGFIPFSWEEALVSDDFATGFGPAGDATVTTRLQALADRITAAQPLAEGVTVTLHYVNTPRVNAFAGLGGHIYVFKGLLDQLHSENAVAALLGHEIGHVAGRHVVKNLSGAVLVQISFSMVFGNSAELSNLGAEILQLEMMAFSRDMEGESDAFALTSQEALFGHFGGYMELFSVLGKGDDKDQSKVLSFLQSHPQSESRLERARVLALERGLEAEGETIPWPDAPDEPEPEEEGEASPADAD